MVYALLGDDSISLTPISLKRVGSAESSADSSLSEHALRYEIELEPLDFCNKSPLTYAKELGFEEIAILLTNAIRKRNT
jgi:hypothetical protein